MNSIMVMTVENDKPLNNLITTSLKIHDYRYITAINTDEAIIGASSYDPDIVLIDPDSADIDGQEIIKKIRTWSNMPIIVISEKNDTAEKVRILDAGADDYMLKPFSVEELLARIRVSERRIALMQTLKPQESVFTNGDLRIDYAAGCAYLKGKQLHLTPIEYKLLCILSRNVGKVLTHTFITNNVWGKSWENDITSLRVFMAALRKKLSEGSGSGADSGSAADRYIITHVGVGYRMDRI